MRHSTKKLLLGAITLPLSIALAGCMVGPDYARPKVAQPSAFKSPATTQPVAAIPAEWWRLYNDPQLDHLIEMAKESNQDVRQAIARVDEARALARISATALLPTIDANPNVLRSRTSGNRPSVTTGKSIGTSATFNDWQVAFDLAYEIDVWGRVRRSVEASKAQAQANDLLAKSITPPLIQYEQLQRWDGRLPLFTGSGGVPLIDVSKLTNGATPAASPAQ